jgi:hypothetical protein
LQLRAQQSLITPPWKLLAGVTLKLVWKLLMEMVCREPRWDFLVLAEGLLVTPEVAKMVFLFLRPMDKSRDLDEVLC